MKGQRVVLCSNFSVGGLFSRGCLLPGFVEPPGTIEDSWETWRSATDQLPAKWVSSLTGSGRNIIPIALLLTADRSTRRISGNSQQFEIEAVCLGDVDALAFRSEKELERFRSLEFSNYDLASTSVSFVVMPHVFEGPDNTDETASLAALDLTSVQAAVRGADCITGLIAALATQSPGVKSWMTDFQTLLKKTKGGSAKATWPRKLFNASLTSDGPASSVGDALLSACATTLREYPVEGGWPSEDFLARVTAIALERAAERDKLHHDIQVWARRAADVIASRAEPQSLADDAFVAERAVLLLLLRGDTNGLEGMRHGDALPGAQVQALSMTMACYRTGLRALPSSYKHKDSWVRYLGELFVDSLANGAAGPSKEILARLKVDYRSERPLQGEWTVSLDKDPITVVPSHSDRGLERLFALGRDLGYELREFGDDQLAASVEVAGKPRDVILGIVRRTGGAGASVRFSSPAARLSGPLSRTRIPKEMLIGLLMQHSAKHVSCRFAIDPEFTRVDVVADHLLSTLDEAEFKTHMVNVATMAAELLMSRDIQSVNS